MELSISKHQRNIAAFIHASTFARYFFPFGNFILPLVLWVSNKKESDYIDHHGKQALNFQISILLYSIVIGIFSVSSFFLFTNDFITSTNIFDHNVHTIDFDRLDHLFRFRRNWIPIGVGGLLGLGLTVLNIVCSIIATIRASEGIRYRYPLTINFIK
ncbi:DUF4870 domain-containing protein [Leptobacterium sp. I13]|uniref:DUF4870 domain-containing protein n=1 Tax=Leptobacterium meishanense TaxID=3128904 RepID=UPI0030EDFD78